MKPWLAFAVVAVFGSIFWAIRVGEPEWLLLGAAGFFVGVAMSPTDKEKK